MTGKGTAMTNIINMHNQAAQIPTPPALIPIGNADIGGKTVQTVDARRLHEFLEVGRDYTSWIKGRIERYDFAEGRDFVNYYTAPQNGGGSGNRGLRNEYLLTLDMAKELSMVENNEKGRQARQYFIKCESMAKAAASLQLPDFTDPVAAARAWADEREKLKLVEMERVALKAQATADRPKVVFADSIEVSKSSILIGELAKLIRQATGMEIGQNRLFDYLRDHGYLIKNGSQRNMPTQRSIDAGWMEIKEGTRIGSSGESHITKTTKITGKGQIYFINKFHEMRAVRY
jgi:anti-repressor protein